MNIKMKICHMDDKKKLVCERECECECIYILFYIHRLSRYYYYFDYVL